MTAYRGWLCLVLGLMLSSLATASAPVKATKKHLSLKEAVLLAVRQSPAAKHAQLQRTLEKFQLEIANNEFGFSYHVKGQVNYTVGEDQVTTLTSGISYKTGFGTELLLQSQQDLAVPERHLQLSINQPLLRGFGWAANISRLHNAEDQERANQLGLEIALTDVIDTTLQSYRQLVQAHNEFTVQKLALSQAKKVLDEYRIKVKVGQLPRANLDQQQAQVLTQQLALETQKNHIDSAYRRLLLILGLSPLTDVHIDSDITLLPYRLPKLEAALKQAEAHNPSYKQELLAYRVKKRDVAVAKNHQLWQLDAHGDIDTDGKKTVSLNLGIPIADKARQGELLSAKTAVAQARISLQKARDQLAISVTDAWRDLHSQRKQIQLAQSKQQYAKRVYQAAVTSHLYGRASAFEVVQQHKALIDSALDVINRKINYLNALAEFHKLLGITLEQWQVKVEA